MDRNKIEADLVAAQDFGAAPEEARKLGLFDPVEPLAQEMVCDPRLQAAPMPEIPFAFAGAEPEDMLKGLIAECHFLMRHVTLPSMCTTRDSMVRREFLNTAMELARTGAYIAQTIGQLRHGSVTEILQRHQVEHSVKTTTPAPAGSGATS